jgi:hypothetical protein
VVSQAQLEEARAEAADWADLLAEGERLYAEAMRFKESDPTQWQKKLGEALGPFEQVVDEWNEIAARMPEGEGKWDVDQVATHYLRKQAGQVNDASKRVKEIRQDITLSGD